MNIDPMRVYGYLEKVRARVLHACRGLSDEQYTRSFAIGPGSLARTLTHVVISEWYYVERMQGHEVAPYAEWPVKDENPPSFAELERLWGEQAMLTRRAVETIRDWETALSYVVTNDEGQRIRVTASPADQFIQLFQHEVHHRAQVLNMLRQLGVPSLGDVDYNWEMFERSRES